MHCFARSYGRREVALRPAPSVDSLRHCIGLRRRLWFTDDGVTAEPGDERVREPAPEFFVFIRVWIELHDILAEPVRQNNDFRRFVDLLSSIREFRPGGCRQSACSSTLRCRQRCGVPPKLSMPPVIMKPTPFSETSLAMFAIRFWIDRIEASRRDVAENDDVVGLVEHVELRRIALASETPQFAGSSGRNRIACRRPRPSEGI